MKHIRKLKVKRANLHFDFSKVFERGDNAFFTKNVAIANHVGPDLFRPKAMKVR